LKNYKGDPNVAILEVVCGGNDVLRAVFAAQRTTLEKTTEVVSVDLTGVGSAQRKKVLKSIKMAEVEPSSVVIRGVDFVDEVVPAIGQIPFFIDHCTPLELGPNSPLKPYIQKARRVFCYSEKASEDVRKTGTGKITVACGPALPRDRIKSGNPVPCIGVLDHCSKSRQVLMKILNLREQRKNSFDVVSSLGGSKVLPSANNFETVEMADFVVASYEDMDFGQPHDGAILCLSLGKPLCTAKTSAMYCVGFPEGALITANKHQLHTYPAAVSAYLYQRSKYDSFTWPAGPNPDEVPNDILSYGK
jgi:hypothetical protein